MRYATGLRREEARLSQLTIGLKCGESDTTSGFASNPAVGVVTERLTSSGATIMFGETPELTGAEQVLVNSFEKDELRTEFMKVYKSYFDFILSQGVDLLGSQPNKGNIAGGISTIEEKAMGNIQKIGHAKIHGILDTAEAPGSRPVLHEHLLRCGRPAYGHGCGRGCGAAVYYRQGQ